MAFGFLDPWVVLSLPTVWALWYVLRTFMRLGPELGSRGVIAVCVTFFVSVWRPSDTTVLAPRFGPQLPVPVACVLMLGALCLLLLIGTCQRWITNERVNSNEPDDLERPSLDPNRVGPRLGPL